MAHRPADAVVVLGAQVFSDGTPSPSLRRRVERAVAEMRARRITVLVGCGGIGDGPRSEAETIRDLAVAAGVPPASVLLEDRSTSTLEHARNLRPIAAEHGWNRLLIVTDRFHLPRARFLFRRVGFDVEGAASDRGDASLRRWVVEGWLREMAAWGKALWDVARGRTR
ncbi:MAG: YdcF family protein [Acidimicrobiia bacterium]|nr:YdcF family protein [Acidimicrobiia bacterium]